MLVFSWVLSFCCVLGLSIIMLVLIRKNRQEGYQRALLGVILFAVGTVLFRIAAITLSFPPGKFYRVFAPTGLVLTLVGIILLSLYFWNVNKSQKRQ